MTKDYSWVPGWKRRQRERRRREWIELTVMLAVSLAALVIGVAML